MGYPVEKYTDYYIQELKSGKSAGRFQARFRFFNVEKNRWDYHSQLIPKDVAKKSQMAREKWAKRRLEEKNAEIANALITDPDRKNDSKTVDEMVLQYLDYQLSSNAISLGAYEDQKAHYLKHISPSIGEIGFLSLTRYDIQSLLTKLNSIGLSQSTIYHYMKVVRKVYNYYCPLENIPNPFIGIVLLRGKPRKSHLTQEQTQALFDAVDEEFEMFSPMRVGIYLAFYCGLRRGEICGLRWRNINLENGWMVIDTAIGTSKGKKWTKLPKGNKERTFPINPSLLEYLKDMNLVKQPEQNDFVLTCSEDFFSPHVFTQQFTLFRKKYELTDAYDNAVVPHGIRHNLASIGIRAGMDMATLSNMFGHSSIAMTTDVYGDATQMGKLIGAEKLAQQFENEGL